jgi:hypothetical protein
VKILGHFIDPTVFDHISFNVEVLKEVGERLRQIEIEEEE